MPELLAADTRTTVVFAEHPHPELTPMSAAGRAKARADELGWTGGSIRFEAWRPHERRFELPQVADLAVVTHRPGVETDLSLRTRLVDLLWLGLPVIVTDGGTMARVVAEEGAGRIVPPNDPAAVARAVRELIDDPEARRRAGAAGRAWAARRTWRRMAAPLLDFASSPHRDTNRDRFVLDAGGAVHAADTVSDRISRRLRRLVGR